jgi:hypothetical protein
VRDPAALYLQGEERGQRAKLVLTGGVAFAAGAVVAVLDMGEVTLIVGWLLMLGGLTLLTLAFWRRRRAFVLDDHGIEIRHGGDWFGERTRVPWKSVRSLQTRPAKTGVWLVYEQQGVSRPVRLPGRAMDQDAAVDVMRRVRRMHPQVEVGPGA